MDRDPVRLLRCRGGVFQWPQHSIKPLDRISLDSGTMVRTHNSGPDPD